MDPQWGEAIQKAYVQFLNYGNTPNWSFWETYPSIFYEQLVKDNFIAPDAWREQMGEARSLSISRLQKQHAVTAMRYSEDISTRQIKLTNIEYDMMKYRDGSYDSKVELMAKQWLVLDVFKAAKKLRLENIYVLEEKNV